MGLKIKRESIVTKAYYIGIFFLVFRFILANTYLESSWLAILTYIGLFFEIMRIICVKREIKYLLFLVGAITLGLLAYDYTQSLSVLYFFIIVFASYKVDYSRFVKVLFNSISLSILIVFLIAIVGLIPLVNADGFVTLGFMGKNGLSIYLSTLLVLYMYLHYEKKSVIMHLFIMFVALIISLWLNSCTSIITTFVILSAMIISKRTSKTINRIMLCALFGICVIVVCFLSYRVVFFGESAYDWIIDKMLTGRLLQANYYFKWYGITSFGNVFKEYADKSHYFLDFGYMNMLIQNGYVYFIINMIVYVYSVIKLIKENDVKTTLLVLYVLIMLIAETTFCNPFFNPVYPIFSYYLLSKSWKLFGKKRKEQQRL